MARPTVRPAIKNTANRAMARKNKVLATAAEPDAMPVNPKTPAIIEITKKIKAQRNIAASYFLFSGKWAVRLIPQNHLIVWRDIRIGDFLTVTVDADPIVIDNADILAVAILHRHDVIVPINGLNGPLQAFP